MRTKRYVRDSFVHSRLVIIAKAMLTPANTVSQDKQLIQKFIVAKS